jgi:xylan 1,4-beta-xylosidase
MQLTIRRYHALFTVGFFDPSPKYASLDFSDVGTPEAMQLAHRAAVEGMTLLKNDDDILPVSSDALKVAVIGPFAKAEEQMQGTYSGPPKHIRSPLWAFRRSNWDVSYALGTDIDTNSTSGFREALRKAADADLVIYLGGIDGSIESETNDRESLTWPGNQLDLIEQLAEGSAPVVVVQFGGGQLDDSSLVSNDNVKGLIWAGYPSQDGGPALLEVMTGASSIAGRLPTTQYPADYVNQVNIFEPNLRPNATYPGRTYMWYTGEPVFPFGYGMHYTTFDYSWSQSLKKKYNIQQLVHECKAKGGVINDATPWTTVSIDVKNTGKAVSDYSGLLFLSSDNAGPAPRPNKVLVAYDRLRDIATGGSQTLDLALDLGSLARADENGDLTIFPGDYKLTLDVDDSLTFEFSLRGEAAVIDTLPAPQDSYDFTVPVHIQPPSYQAYSPNF